MSDSDVSGEPETADTGFDGGIAATHDVVTTITAQVGPSTADEFNTIRAAIMPIACFRLDDVRFAFDSSLVLPEAAQELDGLAGLIAQHVDPGLPPPHQHPPLSIFGHADPVGTDDYNKTLSGRRAEAVYGLLTRKTEIWERLFSQPFGGDKWGTPAIQVMLNALLFDPQGPGGDGTTEAVRAFQRANGLNPDGQAGPATRKALFLAYMDAICRSDVSNAGGKPFSVPPEKFLGAGKDSGGKGDIQGCSDFNPIKILSQSDIAAFQASGDKTARNSANAPDRRVLVFLFQPGTRIDPAKWPCPRAEEGAAGCRKRFWSDAARRRAPGPAEREFEKTQDTFACRFYQRLADRSPCDGGEGANGQLFVQCLSGDGLIVLAGRKYRIKGSGDKPRNFVGVLNEDGNLRHRNVPPGDYLLSVQGCSEDSQIAVLPLTLNVPQVRMLENGRLAIRVETPDGDPIFEATVEVAGLGRRLTDEDGIAYFGTVPERDFTFTVSKADFQPATANGPGQQTRQSLADTASSSSVTAPAGADRQPASGTATVKETRTDVTVNLKPPTQPAKVVRITATQAATHSRRDPKRQLPDNTLGQSFSSDTSLTGNKPVVLIRGSRSVFLTAITDPPGGIVTWDVTQNQTTSTPPQVDPKVGPTTLLSTDTTGSFSVTARLGATSIVWNVVLVGVELGPNPTITTRDSGFIDINDFIKTPAGRSYVGLGVGETYNPTKETGVASGEFVFGKHPWSSKLQVTLTGGGTANDLGCDQIHLEILQNVNSDNTVGEYETKLALHQTAFNLLDAPNGSPPNFAGPTVGAGVQQGKPVLQSPFVFTDGMIKVNRKSATSAEIDFGDSPGAGSETVLSGSDEKLQKIRGFLEFRTALVSWSNDSVNAIVAHADAQWRVDYSGDVSVSSLIGKWSKTTAGVTTIQTWKAILSSSGVHGTDAGNALLEIFPPRAVEELNKPRTTINKA